MHSSNEVTGKRIDTTSNLSSTCVVLVLVALSGCSLDLTVSNRHHESAALKSEVYLQSFKYVYICLTDNWIASEMHSNCQLKTQPFEIQSSQETQPFAWLRMHVHDPDSLEQICSSSGSVSEVASKQTKAVLPGLLPSSENQCILGKVDLRSIG